MMPTDPPPTAGLAASAGSGMADPINYSSGTLVFRPIGPTGFELVIPPYHLALSYQFRRNVSRSVFMAVAMVAMVVLAFHLRSSDICLSVGATLYVVIFGTCIGYTWWHPTLFREVEASTVVTFDGRVVERVKSPFVTRRLLAEQVRRVKVERLPFSRCGVIRLYGGRSKGFSTGWHDHRELLPVADEIRRRLRLATEGYVAVDGCDVTLTNATPPIASAALLGLP